MNLKEKIAVQLPAWRERVSQLVKEHGNVKVDEVNVGQVYGGMRDIKSMVTDISYVDPQEGIRLRGFSIPEVLEKLPKPKDMEIPPAGGLYYLLLVGEIPSLEDAMRSPRLRREYPEGHAGRNSSHDDVLPSHPILADRITIRPPL
jgi:citrate synthase